jgi:hypothetical protein
MFSKIEFEKMNGARGIRDSFTRDLFPENVSRTPDTDQLEKPAYVPYVPVMKNSFHKQIQTDVFFCFIPDPPEKIIMRTYKCPDFRAVRFSIPIVFQPEASVCLGNLFFQDWAS